MENNMFATPTETTKQQKNRSKKFFIPSIFLIDYEKL